MGALVPEFLPALPPARYDGPHFGFTYEVLAGSGHHWGYLD